MGKFISQSAKKNPSDKTSSKRAASHLDNLAKKGGKRLPVDLSEDHVVMLDALMADGYGATAAAVIREAISEAHEKRFKDR